MTVPEAPMYDENLQQGRSSRTVGTRWGTSRRIESRFQGPRFACAAILLLLPAMAWAQTTTTPDAGLDAPQTMPAGASQNAPLQAPAGPDTRHAGMTAGAGMTGGAGMTNGAGMIDSSRYVIGSDDVLQVTVWKEPTLSGTVPVRPDGMISLVLLGDVRATGLTPMQLGTDITDRLKKYIQDPSVTVVVTAVNSQKIFLIGEVQRVGPVVLSPGMTPLQAVAAAGGLTNFANGKHMYILRGPEGKQQKLPFNYKQALKGDNRQMLVLQPGDTIVVP